MTQWCCQTQVITLSGNRCQVRWHLRLAGLTLFDCWCLHLVQEPEAYSNPGAFLMMRIHIGATCVCGSECNSNRLRLSLMKLLPYDWCSFRLKALFQPLKGCNQQIMGLLCCLFLTIRVCSLWQKRKAITSTEDSTEHWPVFKYWYWSLNIANTACHQEEVSISISTVAEDNDIPVSSMMGLLTRQMQWRE